MTRLRRPIVAVFVLVGLMLPTMAAAQTSSSVTIDEVDTSLFPQVLVLVTAPSEFQAELLGPTEWVITEGGEVQAVTTAEPIAAETIEVVLVIDTSGSMAGTPLTQAKSAAGVLLDRLPSGASVAVVGFGDTPRVVQDSTTDLDEARVAIDSLSAEGETALFDAVLTGLAQFRQDGQHQSLIVLSDGGDTVSTTSQQSAVAALADFQGRLFAVELDTADTESEPLALLAAAADGVKASADDPAQLAAIYDDIASRIVSQYILAYQSVGSGPTTLGVRLITEGQVNPTIRLIRLPFVGGVPGTTPADPAPSTTLAPPSTLAGATAPVPPFASGAWPWVGIAALFLGLAGLFAPLIATSEPSAPKRVRPTFRTRGSRALEGVARGLIGAAERATGTKRRGGLEARIERAGLKLRAGEYLTSIGALAVLGAAVGATVFRSGTVAIVLALLVAIGGMVFLRVRTTRRQRAFEDQLPDILTMLSSTIRTGYAPPQATELVAKESADPAREELLRVVAETRLGRDYIDALHSAAARVESEDFEWIVEAMEINRDVGGDVSEILDTVSGTIRSRIQLRRTISALSAEGRLSAWILVFTPIFLATWLWIRDPDYLAPLVETPLGVGALVFAVIAMAVGILVVRRIINLKP